MSSPTLIRWGGLAAAVGAALLLISVVLGSLSFFLPQFGGGVLSFRSVLSVTASVLVSVGLVALYAHQSEATGILGLVGFLLAYTSTLLVPAERIGVIGWVVALTTIGWAVFGIASLRARVYPQAAVVGLIIGGVLLWVANISLAARGMVATGPLIVVTEVASVIFDVSIAWLGFSLFRKRSEEVYQPTHAS